ncbi:uncharacterized protein LOC121593548 [Anopheles merus]|uniref:uncharacterized protein LOC121593548 n=2 Tax=Anopheles merus TaxID=30066 RepID=UPI001BE49A37|nr:uncharacterized protein LOC121593548 [Anopheles merus]
MMNERAVQDASCVVVETQQQLGETSSISPERRVSVVEDAANKDESASQPAGLPRDLEVRRKRLEIRRKQFELEKVQKELELELCELELEEEISDRGSHVSDFVRKTEVWMQKTNDIGTNLMVHHDGECIGHSPSTTVKHNSATTGATQLAAEATPTSSREECTMADASRCHQPSSPAMSSFPPDYDRTLAEDQAAAMEREYAQWRRAVEDSIKTHRTKHFGQPNQVGAMAMAAPYGVNSTLKPTPANQNAVMGNLLTPSQKAARDSTPKELPVFSGSVEQWPLFIAVYERSTKACGFTDDENLIRLQQALRGPALESVDHVLLLPDGLKEVLDILRTEYGRPDLIVDNLVDKVRRLPPVRAERLDTLANFGKAVRKLCATIKASGLEDYNCNVALLKELVAKLPAERRLEWARYKVKLPRKTIEEFGKWFTEIAVAASTEVNPFEKYTQHTETTRSQPARRPLTNHHHLNVHRTTTCALCHDTCRTLVDCARFHELTIQERRVYINEHRRCHICLGTHRGPCFVRSPCGMDGCQAKHHQLLHVECDTTQRSGSTQHALNTHVSTKPNSLFRYIPITIYGGKKDVNTYAFLDEGSSATFIDRRLIDELGIEGIPHPLCLKRTGDTTREEANSLMVSLRVSGVYRGAPTYDLQKVHTVNELSLPAQTLPLEELAQKYSHLRGLPIASYVGVKPRILIGMDNIHLGKPSRCAEGSFDEPIAAKTRLGWTVFGPCATPTTMKYCSPR